MNFNEDFVNERSLSAPAKSFYRALVEVPPTEPEEDYLRFCRAWLDYSEADWVWLWLSRETPELENEWHLVGSIAKQQDFFKDLKPTVVKTQNGVFDYCCLCSKVEWVKNPSEWEAKHGDTIFNVATKNSCTLYGCRSFITIPIYLPSQANEAGDAYVGDASGLKGAICLHYRSEIKQPIANFDTLHWLGQLTGHMLHSSYQALQKKILLRISELDQKHLVRSSRQPAQALQEYLDELLQLIRRFLLTNGVSIFYRTPSDSKKVQCLASTGIRRMVDHSIIQPNEYKSTAYFSGEGNTGKCFRSGQFINLKTGINPDTDEHRPATYESMHDSKNWQAPALLSPIPLPVSERQGRSSDLPNALGVIRCTEHSSLRFSSCLRVFDPIEIETLAFIGFHVGPALEVMVRNLQLQDAIDQNRHELRSSIGLVNNMLIDLTEDIKDPDSSSRIEMRAFDLIDLQMYTTLAVEFVERLYTDKGARGSAGKVPVKLADIIYELKNVMDRYAQKSKRIRLVYEEIGWVPRLMVDKIMVQQVLINLVTNAVKYGTPKSTITISARRLDEAFAVDVTNYGIGVEVGEEEKIFEEGYRSPRVEVEGMPRGLGLGLSIARSSMRRLGGDLLLFALRDPTVFSLIFPRALRA